MIRHLTALALLVTAGTATASADSALQQALEPWEPLHVERVDGELVVVLPLSQVNHGAFVALVKTGICQFGAYYEADLDGIEKIVVVNRHGAAGFVFEPGAAGCEGLSGLSGQNLTIAVLSQTHTLTRLSDPYRF